MCSISSYWKNPTVWGIFNNNNLVFYSYLHFYFIASKYLLPHLQMSLKLRGYPWIISIIAYCLKRNYDNMENVRINTLLVSLVLFVCFVDRCLSFCTFSFVHCVVCSSSIYGFWLPLWYLQTLLFAQMLMTLALLRGVENPWFTRREWLES